MGEYTEPGVFSLSFSSKGIISLTKGWVTQAFFGYTFLKPPFQFLKWRFDFFVVFAGHTDQIICQTKISESKIKNFVAVF